jgi:UDP-glucose 4-epimerase
MTRGSRPIRVLVTGGTGFIGRALLTNIPTHWTAVATTRRDVALPAGIEPVPLPTGDEPLPQRLAEGFDVLIHLAGNSNHGLAETEPWTDLEATGRVGALVVGRVPARRIVHLSSAAVYAGLVGPVSPVSCVRPAMAYALSKLYVEGLVQSRVASGSAESATVLRLYNAFGPGERPTRLVPRVAEAISSGAEFVLSGDADSLSDPVHVDDVVRALVAAAESSVSGTFDLCGGDPVPLRRQLDRIALAIGRPLRGVRVEPREGEVPIAFFSDVGPTCAALGIPPPESFEDAVRRYAVSAGWLDGA